MSSDEDLQRQISDLRGNDSRRRDQVLRQLYESPMVAAKVDQWIQQYAKGKLAVADVIQDSVMITYRHVRDGKFRGESKLTTYLLKICQNVIRNGGRLKSLRVTDSLDHPAAPDISLTKDSATTELEKDEASKRLELRNRLLRKVLAKLTDNCRSALALYYTENKSTREIAEIKNQSGPDQAKKLLHRCRKRLRQLIAEDPDLNNFLKTNR